MNSRVTWSVEGIDPAVRERAEVAARRAGLSLDDWINAQLGNGAAPQQSSNPTPPRLPPKEAQDVAEIHHRLDAIASQIEHLSRPAPRAGDGVARQLNDAISRLDARLSQIAPANHAAASPSDPAERVERAAAHVYRGTYHEAPPLSPASIDTAVAEIAARMSELDRPAAPAPRPAPAPPIAPPMPQAGGPDFSSLERQLLKITSQIEALAPASIEQSIKAFRTDLGEIRQAITEALPRRAIDSMEQEIRALARRIDEGRNSGVDAAALTNLERALHEIYDALRTLTPAEQLAGFDQTVRNLGDKVDRILRASADPGTIQQLEEAIAALRGIVANVASNEALERLAADIQTLSARVDQLARRDAPTESFAALEQRIAALTASLESRVAAPPPESGQLENAVRALSDRLDRLPIGNDSSAAFAHLEQRVSYLLERMESAGDPRSNNLSRVEEGLQDILRQLERQLAGVMALTDSARAPAQPSFDPEVVDAIKRELSDMRFSQAETVRSTQDTLEAVHNTLSHVVDRLGVIETDLRQVRVVPEPQPAPAFVAAARAPVQPELPNPVAAFDAAPRAFAAAEDAPRPAPSLQDILGAPRAAASRHPDLAPDYPLEPGTRPPGRLATPSERIAASESVINEIAAAPRDQTKEQASASSFIAAARRAAQAAAAAAPSAGKPVRGAGPANAEGKGSTIGSKIRSLLVGASVVVIVLGSFKMAMTLLDGASGPASAELPAAAAPVAALPPPPAIAMQPAAPPAPAQPSMTSPTPLGRQSLLGSASPTPAESHAAPVQSPSTAVASADVTGSIPSAPVPAAPPPGRNAPAAVAIPANETLPEAIGGPALRNAALRGDAAAAHEVGLRFTEGKGVAVNLEEAAKWYQRAADAGVIPALFRVGTLYEKGLGVKKDGDLARRYYTQAAERGSAKAMHNLAVLDADGGSKGANYKSAAHWFRKAADRGVADSQFNLGILYARGIGVEQNLAESFKWFSLAAAQGDADAARKRDDVAKRLDPQSLSAAKLAIQTFVAEPSPTEATTVAAPAGGWDGAAATVAAKPAAKRVAR